MEISINDLRVGADPELFLRSLTQGKPWVSAHNLVPGTKKNPYKVKGGAVQHDGLAAEYNIDPASSAEEFVANNNTVLCELSKMLPDFELVNKPCVTFGENVWNSIPEDVKILGCEPDLNAYTRTQNPRPNGEVGFRTAAGHIHVGWIKDMDVTDLGHQDAANILTKELDIYLGLPYLWIDNSPASIKRRKLYGMAGSYRIKPYGAEYRVLPNSWVGNDTLTAWIFNNIKLAFERLLDNKSLQGVVDPLHYFRTENEYTLDSIPYICEEHKIPLPKL